MALRAKAFEFFNRWVPILIGSSGTSKDVYLYGINNLLPNDNLRLINDSGIAKKAIGKLKRYIEADGFSKDEDAAHKVNPDQTADQLLAEISSYAAYNKGFALTIQRDASGKIIEVRSIAFECIRVRKDGSYTYNPLLGQTKFDDKDTKVHPKFFGQTPTVEQLAKIAQPKVRDAKGNEIANEFYQNLEILYVFEKTADNPNYPVADYVAGIEDIKTSVELQGLDLEAVRNGFMPGSILITHEMDDQTKNDQGETEVTTFENVLKQFTGGVKNASGEAKRMALMWLQVKSMEEAPELKSFDAKGIIEGTIAKRDQIERTVARWIGVHPVLLGYSDASILGNQQAISNASKDLTDFVNPLQRMISAAFKQVYPLGDWTISTVTFWNMIPTEVWATLTVDEKRNIGGFPELESKTSAESDKTIDSLNSLSPLVANKVLESLTTDEIRALIGLAPKPVESVTDPITGQPIVITQPTNGVNH